MEKTISMQVAVYGSKYRHDDWYSLSLTDKYLRLRYGGKEAICEWTTGGPRWKSGGNSLEWVLMQDNIFFPPLFKKDLKLRWAWWVRGEYDDEKTKQEIDDLFFFG